jgi:two-component system phosphate regulon sensor histidine kinase PhoR
MTLKVTDTQPDPQIEHIEHERLTSLINSMADAVIAVDEHVNIVLYNGAALNIFDVNTIKVNTPLSKVFKPMDKNNQPYDITAAVQNTKVSTADRDLRLPYADGSIASLYTSIAPVHLGYGQKGQKGHVILLRDITREKSLEEERNEFISVVSHELRTPIAIAEGNISNAEFIAEKAEDITAVRKALKEAHSQVLFLADMINDLSTLSRAERGKLDVDIEAINIHDLVKELGDNYQAQAKAKGLELKTTQDPHLELLHSSKLYVREILQNFVVNAIKYTAKGSVLVDAKPTSKGVTFTVKDTGIGISKSDQERVFDKFFRSEDYRTRQASGTGLGLYVTMKLARLIHAEISLKSELNKGSSFIVFIPNLKPSDLPKPDSPETTS